MAGTCELIAPDWPAPATVRAFATTRGGGASRPPFDTLNLGDHVGDDPGAVAANRAALRAAAGLPAEPCWLEQVHGSAVAEAHADTRPRADASFTRARGIVCAVLTADCLPILLCDARGTAVAAVHGGWRGLARGVVGAAVGALAERGVARADLLAWLGPAIGPGAFEVGAEVRDAILAHEPGTAGCFMENPRGRYQLDIWAAARALLAAAGVARVYGGGRCTVTEAGHFFSYRRDGPTGRMATGIWLAPPDGPQRG